MDYKEGQRYKFTDEMGFQRGGIARFEPVEKRWYFVVHDMGDTLYFKPEECIDIEEY